MCAELGDVSQQMLCRLDSTAARGFSVAVAFAQLASLVQACEAWPPAWPVAPSYSGVTADAKWAELTREWRQLCAPKEGAREVLLTQLRARRLQEAQLSICGRTQQARACGCCEPQRSAYERAGALLPTSQPAAIGTTQARAPRRTPSWRGPIMGTGGADSAASDAGRSHRRVRQQPGARASCPATAPRVRGELACPAVESVRVPRSSPCLAFRLWAAAPQPNCRPSGSSTTRRRKRPGSTASFADWPLSAPRRSPRWSTHAMTAAWSLPTTTCFPRVQRLPRASMLIGRTPFAAWAIAIY